MDIEEMTKPQTPSSRKTPIPKHQNADFLRPGLPGLKFGAWKFFGPWTLEFGALAITALSLAGCVTENAPSDSSSSSLNYPVTRKTNVVDDYNGVKVSDPYRWLEDDNSPETKAWVDGQNKITIDYLQSIPELPAIRARLTKLWNYERYGVPFKEGGRYFFTKNDGLQNQSVLYTLATLEQSPKVLLDPNQLSP